MSSRSETSLTIWRRRRLLLAIAAIDALQADGMTWGGPDLAATRAALQGSLDSLGPGTARALGHWTRDQIIDAIQEFHRRYGRAPRAIDWDVSMARAKGRDDLASMFYEDGCWPHASNVYGKNNGCPHPFKTWNDAIRSAGFEPRIAGKYDRSQVTA